MNDKDIELMERYIYQVVRRLPKNQQDDVAMELRELIGDMTEEKGSLREALIALGDPEEFAKKYAGESRYLIGPLYYDAYWKVLKIALPCVVIAVSIIKLIQVIVEGYDPSLFDDVGLTVGFFTQIFSVTLSSAISSAMGIFGTVTIVFMIMEHYKVDLEEGKRAVWPFDESTKKTDAQSADSKNAGSQKADAQKADSESVDAENASSKNTGSENIKAEKSAGWSPDQLIPVPNKKSLLPRGDSIVDIVFSVVLGALLIFAPHMFGLIWVFDDSAVDGSVLSVPIFNLDMWNLILPFILISLLAGLADAILRVIIGRYNLKVMVSSIVSGTIQIVCAIIALKFLPIWNPNFGDEFRSFINTHFSSMDFGSFYNMSRFSNIVLAFVIGICLIEMSFTVYRTLRYGMSEKKS